MRSLIAFVVLAAAAAAACDRTSRPASGGPSPRLYVLDGGVLASDTSRYRLTDADVQSVSLSIAAYLIVHPQGVLLWDAGAIADDERQDLPAGAEHRVRRADGQERVVTLAPMLEAQLRASGYAPDAVTHLALSHYHWDHTADANAFAHATWLVRQADRDAMFAEPAPGGARPATYAALKGSTAIVVTADEHDLFGDGSVILKSAPGHSEGHQVLYVKLAKTGGVVLSGDLYHYPEERTLNRLPTFEVSEEQTAASRRALEAFLMKTGAALWIQHDLVNHRSLRKAPESYE